LESSVNGSSKRKRKNNRKKKKKKRMRKRRTGGEWEGRRRRKRYRESIHFLNLFKFLLGIIWRNKLNVSAFAMKENL
jgi:hypothetical protein